MWTATDPPMTQPLKMHLFPAPLLKPQSQPRLMFLGLVKNSGTTILTSKNVLAFGAAIPRNKRRQPPLPIGLGRGRDRLKASKSDALISGHPSSRVSQNYRKNKCLESGNGNKNTSHCLCNLMFTLLGTLRTHALHSWFCRAGRRSAGLYHDEWF